MGLMDQITALKWVQRYIYFFGGDPDLVTVFGQSAGGASASWMQITPLTNADHNEGRPLAHGFIPMSGSALEYWTLEHDEQNSFEKQVAATGCATVGVTNKQMMACVGNLTVDELVYASLNVSKKDLQEGGLGFIGQVPVVQTSLLNDPEAKGLPRVIIEDPVTSLRENRFLHAPLMLGSTRDEGSLVIGIFYNGYIKPRGLENDENFLTNDLLVVAANAFGISDITNAISNTFRLSFMPNDLYMGIWENIVGPMVDCGGMMFLKSGLWTLAHEVAAHEDSKAVYFYSFEHESQNTMFDWMFISTPDIPIPGGVGHGDDLMYLFSMPTYFSEETDINMVRMMTTLYTNFAKWGNPTPEEVKDEPGQWGEFCPKWQQFDADTVPFMLLRKDITLERDFIKRWNYNKYGYPNMDLKP